MTDVLIVGAGLAGSAAAIQLASRGYDVEVLDQAFFPRRKPCGEGLFSHGVRELAALGVLDNVIKDAAVLESMSFSLDGLTVKAPLPASSVPHLGLRRDLLDEALFNAAAKAGARMATGIQVRRAVRDGIGFRLETTTGVRKARVIIAADGIHSRIRRDAGLDHPTQGRRFGVSAHLKAPRTIPRVEVSFEKDYEVYVTPVGGQRINVALLLKDPQSMGFKGNLAGRFRDLVALADIEGELTDEPMMAGPFPARATSLWRDNLVLIGDAAGFFDPITGEGMSLALRSARLGASAVARYLESCDGGAFEHYERQHRAMTRNATILAQLMLFLAAHRRLGRQAIQNLQGHPETLTRLIAVNNGLAGFTDLRLRNLSALVLGR